MQLFRDKIRSRLPVQTLIISSPRKFLLFGIRMQKKSVFLQLRTRSEMIDVCINMSEGKRLSGIELNGDWFVGNALFRRSTRRKLSFVGE